MKLATPEETDTHNYLLEKKNMKLATSEETDTHNYLLEKKKHETSYFRRNTHTYICITLV